MPGSPGPAEAIGGRARLCARPQPRRDCRPPRGAPWHRQELDTARPAVPAGVHGMSSEPDRILAAEFVAGLLDTQTQAQAEQRIARDPAFAQEVAAWRARLADFDET